MAKQRALLQLARVKCLDETGGQYMEKLGTDQIWLSGYGVDAAQHVSMLSPFEIHPKMNDGDEKVFDPPRTIFELDVPDGPFPQMCTVSFILGERYDGAGQRAVTEKAYADAKAAAPQAKNDGGLSILGSLAVAAVADYVKGRIANATKDKIFDPQQASLQITSGDFRWGDGTKLSPEETLHFAGHEGSYYLTYYWEVENV